MYVSITCVERPYLSMMAASVWHLAQIFGDVKRKLDSPVGPEMVWTPWQSVHAGTSGFLSIKTPDPWTLVAYSSKMVLWHLAQIPAIRACEAPVRLPSSTLSNALSAWELWQSAQVGVSRLPPSNSLVCALSI